MTKPASQAGKRTRRVDGTGSGSITQPHVPSRPATLARLPRLAGRGLIQLYRHTLSGFVGFHCRHLPTCSEYADEALARHGLWAGGWMTLARLVRCHPLGTSGIDPVPEIRSGDSCWYLPWRYGRWSGRHIETRWDRGDGP